MDQTKIFGILNAALSVVALPFVAKIESVESLESNKLILSLSEGATEQRLDHWHFRF